MADTQVVRLLIFRVGRLVCAAAADVVREILPRLPTTRIPGASGVVAGLANVRGSLVTVVEGWRALELDPPTGADAGATTVLLEVGHGSVGGHKTLGFTVDEVIDLLAVRDDELEPRRALPGLDPKLVRAVGRRAGQVFVVLDTDALLAPIVTS